jgi:hypothetical protein
VHLSWSCGDLSGLPVVWINDFKKAAFDAVHEPGHVKCGDIGTPGSGDDNFGFRVQRSEIQRFTGSWLRVLKTCWIGYICFIGFIGWLNRTN